MAERVDAGEARVLFEWTRRGPAPLSPATAELARGLAALEAAGLCPTLGDGKAAGNAAWREGEAMWISPSGRAPARPGEAPRSADMVQVEAFDAASWSASGRGEGLPSSDTPLHWCALMEGPRRCGWSRAPRVTLHGHAIEDASTARALGIPVSELETRFSTREDRAALLELLRAHPYPATRVWVRRGHGFFLAADDLEAALLALADLQARLRSL